MGISSLRRTVSFVVLLSLGNPISARPPSPPASSLLLTPFNSQALTPRSFALGGTPISPTPDAAFDLRGSLTREDIVRFHLREAGLSHNDVFFEAVHASAGVLDRAGAAPGMPKTLWKLIRAGIKLGIASEPESIAFYRRILAKHYPLLDLMVSDDELIAYSVTPHFPAVEFHDLVPRLAQLYPRAGLRLLAMMGAHNRIGGDTADFAHYAALAEPLRKDYAQIHNLEPLHQWARRNHAELGLLLNGFFTHYPRTTLPHFLDEAEDHLWREMLWLALDHYSLLQNDEVPRAFQAAFGFSFGYMVYERLALWNGSHASDPTVRVTDALVNAPSAENFWKSQSANNFLDPDYSLAILIELRSLARSPYLSRRFA